MRPDSRNRRLMRAPVLVALAALIAGAGPRDDTARLPPIVFVSRNAPTGTDAGQIPGLGPHGSTIKVGGRLRIRERDGRVHDLLARGTMWDVADPDVSFDGGRIAFSGLVHPDSSWRIFIVGVDGSTLRCVTPPSEDAIDPCWVNDQLVYVDVPRDPRSLYDGGPIGRLAVVDPSGESLAPRVLHREANGLLDPCVDLGRRRLLFSRWWFNPWRPARGGGVTRDRETALGDSVNQWQVVSALPAALPLESGGPIHGLWDERLAAGGVADRRAGMGIQPAVLSDGRIAAVFTRNTGLAPRPGPTGVQVFTRVPTPGRPIAGAAIGDAAGDPYTEASGLAAPSACAPAALPDGRLIVAMDRGGRGDFGLWLAPGAGGDPVPLVDELGTLELDPAPVLARRAFRPRTLPAARSAHPASTAMEYANRDVFAGRGAPPRTPGARLRLYQLGRGDTLTLARDVPVSTAGGVRTTFEGAAFEQLVGTDGRVLMTAHGPAQVRGFNSGNPAAPSRCVGCHLGHSALR